MKLKKSAYLLVLIMIMTMVIGVTVYAYEEAPMLSKKVAQGELPPVDERLPGDPVVIEPEEEVGDYGGTFYRGSTFIADYIAQYQLAEYLLDYNYPFAHSGAPVPNLARDYEFKDEGRVLLLYLREGIRWSNGDPFTAEDIMFAWEDIMLNEKVLATPADKLVINGKPIKITMIDKYTVKFEAPEPYYMLANNLCLTVTLTVWPKNFLKQYHPAYNEDASYDDFNENWMDWIKGRGKVTLQPWMLEEYVPGQKLVSVRNPYYFKVDTDGNQLPYVDRLVWQQYADRQTIALKAVTGEIDVEGMWVGVQHLPLFMKEKDKRGFDIGWWQNMLGMAMFFNMDAENDVVRTALRNVDFRRALSLAIDREAFGKTFYYDLLEPTGTVFSPNTPYSVEDVKDAYADYNPEKARELLENAGYKDINGDGFRETPSGKELEIIADVAQHDLYTPSVEMLVEQMEKVGVKVVMNSQLHDLIQNRRESGKFEIHVWDFDLGYPFQWLRACVPVQKDTPFWHTSAFEGDYFSPEYEEFSNLMQKALNSPYEERVELASKACEIMANNVFMINFGYYRRPFFIGKRAGNVPVEAIRAPSDFKALKPEQIFIKKEMQEK